MGSGLAYQFQAARVWGISDTRAMVREGTPFNIAAAFPKILQTGEGDYWAYAK